MELVKQYIIQCISAASNNLRLNTQKIEVVAILRDTIAKAENLETDIREMKKITELSTLAIRLNEIYNFLTQTQLDFFKLSDKMKDHSQYLIKDLSHMLDVVNPHSFHQALKKLKDTPGTEKKSETAQKEESIKTFIDTDDIDLDLTKREPDNQAFEKTESIKEKIILEDDKDDEALFFQNYETLILTPIKPLDAFLKDLAKNEFDPGDVEEYAKKMYRNADLSSKIGFDIISNMHKIVAKALMLISSKELLPGKEVIESVRACLIVIVAVVRGKEVDITNYLNRAEEFGRKIQSLRIKEY